MGDYYGVGFFVWSAVMLSAGFAAGTLFRFQREKGGRVKLVLDPEIEARWDAVKVIAATLGVVMFASVIFYNIEFTWEQRACNTRLVDRQNYRAQLADEKDAATLGMVQELLAAQEPGSARPALERYERTVTALNNERRENPLEQCNG